MSARGFRAAAIGATCAAVLATSACSFQGLNSLPVPGAQGTGDGSYELSAVLPNAANLVENAPVLMNDATVGSVGRTTVENWKARITLRLNKGTRVPAGSYAIVGLTSVLGSLNLQIVQPQNPSGGVLPPGGRLSSTNCPDQAEVPTPENRPAVADLTEAQQVSQCTYPTVEQVLSSLSVVLNGGGLAQVGDVVHELSSALGGREDTIRALIPRLTTLVGDLNEQRDSIIDAISGIDRLAASINDQKPAVDRALTQLPASLKLLVDQRTNLTDTLGSTGRLSRTVDDILDANSQDITTIVSNLRPVLAQLQESGQSLTRSLGVLVTFPFAESVIPKIVKGDFVNGAIQLDLTDGRLTRGAFASLGATTPALVYGPEATLGAPAGAAKRNVNPFVAPLQDDPLQKTAPSTPASPTRPAAPTGPAAPSGGRP
ncbi:MCE family protein [Williamsia deligens]|uniref:MCE family protein n=1 Tax=Williamsia deligens TaxID=321325 RepID=A0ABW3G2D9_9NOCA|nr:MCE family protein [Williamsia deligens]MCP2194379.1 phospholipid/cholesterol/gamma-HCH transport system substrate-binding protein [Williamsia deligens]